MKTCTKCGETKSFQDFYTDRRMTDQRSSWCKECTRAYDKLRKADQKYILRNREHMIVIMHRYYAKKRNNGGTYTQEEWEILKELQDYTCPHCGRREPEIKLTVDHIIPVSKGGENNIDNIQGLCGSCNSKKGAIYG